MADKTMDFGEYGEFSAAEITYIVELLAAMTPLDEIQDLFLKFTNNKKILPGAVVQRIQLRFADRIKKQTELYLNNLEGNPLYHLRIRMDIAYKVMKDALKERPSHTIRRSEDEIEVVCKPDNTTVLNALKLVIQDLNKREELDMEKEKDTPSDNSDSPWSMNDGISDVG